MKFNHTYIRLTTQCQSEEMAEILTAFLADYPFESFEVAPTQDGFRLDAHIRCEEWAECREDAISIAQEYGTIVAEEQIKDENWNEQWERDSFQPVAIDNMMVIRSTYHPAPADCSILDIVISPSMSFGSGYHQTTRMMCRMIYDLKPQGNILDMGCGTAILAILAAKMKAAQVHGIDIDAIAAISAYDNARLNRVGTRIETYCGDASLLQRNTYDVFLANINRNILLQDIPTYSACIRKGGLPCLRRRK